MSSLSAWMSWDAGVDLVACTAPDLPMPNVIVHLARLVHTPVGSAASGMVLYAPAPGQPPLVAGFVSTDVAVGAYFGPKIFAGTPFEGAPALAAQIEIDLSKLSLGEVGARVVIGELVLETQLRGLGAIELVQRAPQAMAPFHQQGLEAVASGATLKVNGREVPIFIPPIGLSGGAAAVWAPTGLYAR
jgi:hypothetical protein